MDESAGRHEADPGKGGRRGKRGESAPSVLTPPTGVPAVPDLGAAIPAQRQDSPPTDVTPDVVDPCQCGHAKEAHEHYRPGRDCGICGADVCAAYRAARGPARRRLPRRRH
jgi:hypothetical protein